MRRHRNVTFTIDIMYINEIPFVITTSRAIHFGMAELVKNEKSKTTMPAIKQVIDALQARGILMRHIHIRNVERIGIILNITGHDEHVPEVGRHIWTVKE